MTIHKTDIDPLIPLERIQQSIYLLRGEKVILSYDLALLYGVPTRTLVQAVNRNKDRFPADFMFQLTVQEYANLKSQIVISSWGGRRRSRPYAFTEQGVAMLSSVLRSRRAVEVNIAIMRTFVQLRRILADNKLLRDKIEAMERKYDEQFQQVFAVLEEMLVQAKESKPPIGYLTEAEETPARPRSRAGYRHRNC
jgi:hypothetical protein